jgi:3-oxoadipate enol-lactonase
VPGLPNLNSDDKAHCRVERPVQYTGRGVSRETELPWIEAGGVSFHYRLEGSGPSVVFLHEIGGSLDSWDAVTPELTARFRVFRYDQRGFGLSEKTRPAYGIGALTDDLENLVRAVNLPPPYHIVSLAASSMQALSIYERRPDQIGSLVFCNPAPGVDPSRADALNRVADQAEREGIRGILPAMLDKSYPPALSDRETYENYRGRYLANDPVGFGNAFRMMARSNLIDLLPAVACPTLVIAGRQDYIRAVAVTESIAKKIPGARFEIIDAGHFMPTTSPKPLVQLLQDFWSGFAPH